MINTKSLTKTFGTFKAVDNVNLNIQAGEIYGFLGPNGAGKTTTMLMLLGILKTSKGEINLFNQRYTPDRLDLRARIGVVPENHPKGMWSWMTGNEYLMMFADLFQVKNAEKKIKYLLEQVDLLRVNNQRISEYSRGMMQKLSIVRALLHDPDILFLDEPISGLDPIGIKQVRDLILSENRDGRTIFVSSHLLSEIEKICHRVAIIFRGKLMAEDRMDLLLNKLSKDREICIELLHIPEGLGEKMKLLPYVRMITIDGNEMIIKVSKEGNPRKDISEYLVGRNLVPVKIEEKSISLEDAFVSITQDNIDMFTGIGD